MQKSCPQISAGRQPRGGPAPWTIALGQKRTPLVDSAALLRSPGASAKRSVLPYLLVVRYVLPCVLAFSALSALVSSSLLIA